MLSQQLGGLGEKGGWTKCFSRQALESECPSVSDSYELGTQRKRKGSSVIVESDGEETGQRSKRMKVDVCENERKEQDKEKESTGRSGCDTPTETPAPDSSGEALPEHIKVSK